MNKVRANENHNFGQVHVDCKPDWTATLYVYTGICFIYILGAMYIEIIE